MLYSNVAELIRSAKKKKMPSKISDLNSYSRYIGMTFLLDDSGPYTKLTFDEFLIGNPTLPALHGGVVAGLMENAAVFHIIWVRQIYSPPLTLNMSFDYLRTGHSVDTYARALINRGGRRIINVSVEAWQSDPRRPIASGRGNFLLNEQNNE